jgi:hypothetical protein
LLRAPLPRCIIMGPLLILVHFYSDDRGMKLSFTLLFSFYMTELRCLRGKRYKRWKNRCIEFQGEWREKKRQFKFNFLKETMITILIDSRQLNRTQHKIKQKRVMRHNYNYVNKKRFSHVWLKNSFFFHNWMVIFDDILWMCLLSSLSHSPLFIIASIQSFLGKNWY